MMRRSSGTPLGQHPRAWWALLYPLLAGGEVGRGAEGGGVRTLRVPTEFVDVQQALSAARDGDTVLVAPGEYVFPDPLTFEGKGIRLVSEVGPRATTLRLLPSIPQGPFEQPPPQRASVIIFEKEEPPGTLVKGFTITGGLGTDVRDLCDSGFDDPLGGGVSVLQGANVTIEDCQIRENQSNGGGGVSCFGGSVMLRDCGIWENSAWYSNPGSGGGLLCHAGGVAYLERCSLGGNYGQSGSGLGLRCGSRVTAISCSIKGNTTNENGSGAGVSCSQSELILEDCTISDNCHRFNCLVAGAMDIRAESLVEIRNCTIERSSAEAYGGGISVQSGSVVRILDSRVLDCSSEESGAIDCRFGGHVILESSILQGNWGGAGGLRLERDSSAVLRDSLIVGNGYCGVEALYNATLEIMNCTFADNCESGLVCWDDTQVTIHNSIFYRNGYELCGGGANLALGGKVVSVTHTLVGDSQSWPGEGNLSGDPLIGEWGDYRPRPGSPVIDAGTLEGSRERDIEGNPRPCGGGVDLGAYELGDCEPARFGRGDSDGDGGLAVTDAILTLDYLFRGSAEVGCLDAADAQDDGSIDIADPVYVLLHLFLGGPAPPAPHPGCGVDLTTDGLRCTTPPQCSR